MEENKEMLFDNTRKDANGDINSLEDRLWACANLISLEEHNYSSWLRTHDEFWLRDMEECRNMRQQLMTEILGEGSRHGEAELWCMFKHNAASAVRLWETGNRFASTPERANKYYEMSRNRIGAMLALMDTAREIKERIPFVQTKTKIPETHTNATDGTITVKADNSVMQETKNSGNKLKANVKTKISRVLEYLKCCL